MSIDGKIELRHDTAAQWASFNPVLGMAEPAFAEDTGVLKIGNGATAYLALPGWKNTAQVDAAVATAQAAAVTANDAALQVQAALAALNPTVLAVPGALVMFPSTTAPAGYLKCNGAAGLLRADFPALWAFIQASGILAASEATKQPWQFGPGNGTTTFSLIDARGYALRAWDDGRGVDLGRGLGTYQDDQIKDHAHDAASSGSGAHSHSITDAGHSHAVLDPGHSHAVGDAGHVHSGQNLVSAGIGQFGGAGGPADHMTAGNTDAAYSGVSVLTNTTGVSLSPSGTGIALATAADHVHPITVGGITGGAGTETRGKNVAYLLCIKF